MVSFGRGLFVLRYASCDVPHAPPRVRFAVAHGPSTGVRIVPQPGSVAGELTHVGELAVIASDGPGALEVLIEESRQGGGVGCSLALDRLGEAAQERASLNDRAIQYEQASQYQQPSRFDERVQSGARAQAPAGFMPSNAADGARDAGPGAGAQLVAHLSNRGNVGFALGEWIGGPQAPTPIEGLMIPAALAGQVGLEYQTISIGSDRWSDWVRAGSFAGSQGQGRPLRGMRLRVPATGDIALRVEALFLGAPIDQKVGRTLEFMSSSPFDALVGFRIELVRETARDVAPTNLVAPAASANRLKVFRSSRAS